MKHTIELQPFTIPNFVRQVMPAGKRQGGFQESPAIHLSELSLETLEAMCAEFRLGVLQKAGKQPSPENQRGE
jgi:hypothetical protein